MHKSTFRFLTFPLAGTLFCGMALAQQSSAPSTQQPSAAKPATTAPKTQKASADTKTAPVTLETQKDKISYAIGMNIGKNLNDSLKKDAVDFDPDVIIRGMKDALAGNKPLLTDQEAQTILTALQNDVRKRQQEQFQQASEKNKKEGETFLAANKDKPGVVALPSGLQYKILQPGDGPKPTATDTVVCNYRGTLIDGTEFDSSYKRGQPATFPVGQVIKGWTEALQLMPVGSKWELYVPSSLAYGERGTSGPIGPNQTLIFQVELLSIQAKPAPKLEPVGPTGQSQAQPKTQPQTQPQAQPQAQPPAQPQAKP